jgi:hypothetical protein
MHPPGTLYPTLAVAFAAGVVLFGAGTWLVARSRGANAPGPLQWTQALGVPAGEPLDVAARLDMVERLALVGQPWCADLLRAAAREERDPAMRAAIAAALPA